MAVKTAVNKELEKQRTDKKIGAALSAEVVLYCDDVLTAQLQRLQDELRFVLIVSAATVRPLAEGTDAAVTELAGLRVSVQASSHQKCVRCWHYRADVGSHADHPQICARCVDNICGNGEQRQYA